MLFHACAGVEIRVAPSVVQRTTHVKIQVVRQIPRLSRQQQNHENNTFSFICGCVLVVSFVAEIFVVVHQDKLKLKFGCP